MTPILSATILRTQSDSRLLFLAGQGHERAFEAIVERYRKPMLRYCRRYLPEPRAEDAVQQAFLNAWSALERGSQVNDLRAWLYRISHNAALDAAKRAGYDYSELTEALSLSPAPESEVERRWVMRETLSGVAGLPDNQREALLRTVVEGESRANIARDLQISEGAVRQLVHRARASLRAAATAMIPFPLVSWASMLGGPEGQATARIAELAAGGGAAGGAGALLKAGTVVVAAGALAVGTGSQLERPDAEADATPPAQTRTSDSRSVSDDESPAAQRRGRGGRRPSATSRTTARVGTSANIQRTGNSGPGGGNASPGSVNTGPGSVSVSSGPASGTPGSSGSASGSGSEDGDEDNSGPGSTSSRPGSGGDGDGSGDEPEDDEGSRGPGGGDEPKDRSGRRGSGRGSSGSPKSDD